MPWPQWPQKSSLRSVSLQSILLSPRVSTLWKFPLQWHVRGQASWDSSQGRACGLSTCCLPACLSAWSSAPDQIPAPLNRQRERSRGAGAVLPHYGLPESLGHQPFPPWSPKLYLTSCLFFATQSALLDFFAHRHLFYIFPGCSLGRNETASTSRGLLAHNQATTTRMIDSSEEWYKAGLIKHAVLSAWHSSQHEGKINGYFLLIGSDRNCISDKLNPSILVKCQNIPICKLHLLAAAKRKQLRDQRQKFLFAVGGLRKHVQNSSKQYA